MTDASHHKPLAYKKAYQGACSEDKLLLGQHEMLDAYVKELKKHVHGRGVYRMRRLLNMQRMTKKILDGNYSIRIEQIRRAVADRK